MPSKHQLLSYDSLATLFETYLEHFVSAGPIVSSCGCRIDCYEHRFVHVVKLFGPDQSRLYFPKERSRILATRDGFGAYTHEARRASRLLSFLECLRNPDFLVRSSKLKTGDRVFIKQFVCSQYPYVAAIVNLDQGRKLLHSCMPIRRRQITSWLEGQQLFPRKTDQPPEGG